MSSSIDFSDVWHDCATILVTQIADIKRQKVKLQAMKNEVEEEKQRARQAARERVLLEFERGLFGLAAPASVATTTGAQDPEERESESVHPMFSLKSHLGPTMISSRYETQVLLFIHDCRNPCKRS